AACVCSLRLRGYRVLARRVRTPVGEIDIVAVRRGVLAFVEVKARPDISSAAAALGAGQRHRLARAAEAFLAGRRDLTGRDLRFDVMLVRPARWPVHLVGAWRPDD